MKKIVIAIDSFKGCLSSAEAGRAASEGVHLACPECETVV
ncbi:MAG: glycerate kinase, partial [Bacteroidales bacterium]|nr:glycerate kinase [Bacteroidales bacterium]